MSAFETGPDGEDIGRDPRQMTGDELRAVGHEPKSVIRALRERCMDCCAEDRSEVRKCVSTTCPAWPFRMGSNPWRKPRTLNPERRAAQARVLAKHHAAKSHPTPAWSGD